jgi:8-oxo-dGTP pyrophosphatase MutT (NUDIX family)
METIAAFVPRGAEAGVGLALQEPDGRYLFFLAGSRHQLPTGELFYAGIGGHREGEEDWLACAQREAREEVGVGVEITSASVTWYLPHDGRARPLEVRDRPQPLAFYEMIHPSGTPREGELYRIVVYRARLTRPPQQLQAREIRAVIGLTAEQVIRGPERRPTIQELISEGGMIVAGRENLDLELRVYPLGTARALARILRLVGHCDRPSFV